MRVQILLSACRVSLMVKTPGFHPGNRGSIPLRGTFVINKKEREMNEFFYDWSDLGWFNGKSTWVETLEDIRNLEETEPWVPNN